MLIRADSCRRAREVGAGTIALTGGVAANSRLRERLAQAAAEAENAALSRLSLQDTAPITPR